MRELSLNEIEIVGGGGAIRNPEGCKTDITNGLTVGFVGGSIVFSSTGLWAPVFGGLTALGGMAYAAKNSPNCQAGDDYNTPSKK